jgi:hypothetical protein
LLFGGADEPVEEVPVVDVFVRKLASPNILLAKLSEVIHSDYCSVAKKQQEAKRHESKLGRLMSQKAPAWFFPGRSGQRSG